MYHELALSSGVYSPMYPAEEIDKTIDPHGLCELAEPLVLANFVMHLLAGKLPPLVQATVRPLQSYMEKSKVIPTTLLLAQKKADMWLPTELAPAYFMALSRTGVLPSSFQDRQTIQVGAPSYVCLFQDRPDSEASGVSSWVGKLIVAYPESWHKPQWFAQRDFQNWEQRIEKFVNGRTYHNTLSPDTEILQELLTSQYLGTPHIEAAFLRKLAQLQENIMQTRPELRGWQRQVALR